MGCVGQKRFQRITIHSAVRAQLLQNVVLHTLEGETKLDGVSSAGEEGVVVKLQRVPGMIEFVEPAETEGGGDPRDGNLRRTDGARGNRESRIFGDRVAGNRRVDFPNHTAESHANGICECGIENMSIFGTEHLAAGKYLVDRIFQRVFLTLRPGIEKVTAG